MSSLTVISLSIAELVTLEKKTKNQIQSKFNLNLKPSSINSLMCTYGSYG